MAQPYTNSLILKRLPIVGRSVVHPRRPGFGPRVGHRSCVRLSGFFEGSSCAWKLFWFSYLKNRVMIL